MAWHIFEKLLEEVANYSPFIGKIWITFLFVFRLIMVASIGDTVYSDEQSAFKCNTLQPGCENICFNNFSPISHIRFWAVQILFVGTPSIMFIVYAMHKLTTIPPSSAHKRAGRDNQSISEDPDNQTAKEGGRRRHVAQTSLPEYDEVVQDGKMWTNQSNGKNSKSNNKFDEVYAKPGYANLPNTGSQAESLAAIRRGELKKCIDKQAERPKTNQRSEIKRKVVYQHDSRSEIVKTPSIVRAYAAQAVFRTIIEAGFLYLQYRLFKFDVPIMYVCTGFPCPREVECFVSRPMEKRLFLLFMYAMTILSLVLNAIEIYLLVSKSMRRALKSTSGAFQSTTSDDRLPMEEVVIQRSYRGRQRRPVIQNTFPKLGPFPRSHSFGDSSGDDTMDSDYRFYDI